MKLVKGDRLIIKNGTSWWNKLLVSLHLKQKPSYGIYTMELVASANVDVAKNTLGTIVWS